jgi:XapX domain-containing protein
VRQLPEQIASQAKVFSMKVHLLSLGAGLLVGVIYSLLNVRSPAPPVVALIGLLGILVGEQLVPLQKASGLVSLPPSPGFTRSSRTCSGTSRKAGKTWWR